MNDASDGTNLPGGALNAPRSQPSSGPTAPGGCRITSTDDDAHPWQECRTQRNADGSISSVWERWLAFRQEPKYLSLYARWDPGMIVRRHGHRSPHVLLVLQGELRIDGVAYGPGTHVELPDGEEFGPFEAGPDGCELFEVMMGDPRSWTSGSEATDELLRARGVTPLPDPPIALPAWLRDTRAVGADEDWAPKAPEGGQG